MRQQDYSQRVNVLLFFDRGQRCREGVTHEGIEDVEQCQPLGGVDTAESASRNANAFSPAVMRHCSVQRLRRSFACPISTWQWVRLHIMRITWCETVRPRIHPGSVAPFFGRDLMCLCKAFRACQAQRNKTTRWKDPEGSCMRPIMQLEPLHILGIFSILRDWAMVLRRIRRQPSCGHQLEIVASCYSLGSRC